MVSMAIRNQLGTRELIESKPWNSEARNDVLGFAAQGFGLVCVAIFLYSLGPALGMTLIVVSLAVWALLRSQIASEGEEEEGSCEDSVHDAGINSWSHCADPVWVRSGRFGMSTAATTRPAQRQGA